MIGKLRDGLMENYAWIVLMMNLQDPNYMKNYIAMI